jgi:hypothetical protein
MRRWLLSALIAGSIALPAYAAQESAKPEAQDKKDAKQAQRAVTKARKHAAKAEELPNDAARKADEEGRKGEKKARNGGPARRSSPGWTSTAMAESARPSSASGDSAATAPRPAFEL